MRPSEALEAKRDEVRAIIAGSCVSNPRVFGSVARGEDVDGSDLDILVTVANPVSYFDIADVKIALEEVLGVAVDLVIDDALKPHARPAVMKDARPL